MVSGRSRFCSWFRTISISWSRSAARPTSSSSACIGDGSAFSCSSCSAVFSSPASCARRARLLPLVLRAPGAADLPALLLHAPRPTRRSARSGAGPRPQARRAARAFLLGVFLQLVRAVPPGRGLAVALLVAGVRGAVLPAVAVRGLPAQRAVGPAPVSRGGRGGAAGPDRHAAGRGSGAGDLPVPGDPHGRPGVRRRGGRRVPHSLGGLVGAESPTASVGNGPRVDRRRCGDLARLQLCRTCDPVSGVYASWARICAAGRRSGGNGLARGRRLAGGAALGPSAANREIQLRDVRAQRPHPLPRGQAGALRAGARAGRLAYRRARLRVRGDGRQLPRRRVLLFLRAALPGTQGPSRGAGSGPLIRTRLTTFPGSAKCLENRRIRKHSWRRPK